MAKCSICESPTLKDIDIDLDTGVTGVEISKKYGFSQMSISRHKQHRARNNLEDVRTIINIGVDRDAIKITNPSDYIKLLEYEERQKLARCEVCTYRMAAERPVKSIEDALKEFMDLSEDDTDIYLTKEENALFIEWLKSLSVDNELRKKYQYYEDKVGTSHASPKSLTQPLYVKPQKVNEVFIPEK